MHQPNPLFILAAVSIFAGIALRLYDHNQNESIECALQCRDNTSSIMTTMAIALVIGGILALITALVIKTRQNKSDKDQV